MSWKILAWALHVAFAVSARSADPFEAVRGKCRLDDSLTTCRAQIALRELTLNEATVLLNRYPFHDTHSFLNSLLKQKRVVVWTDDKPVNTGWPLYIFGSFSEDGKLTDLVGTHFGYTDPLVHGTYSKQVESITNGMSVTKMYESIGKRNPRYVQNNEGNWIVKFDYRGHPEKVWTIEADAATGIIFGTFSENRKLTDLIATQDGYTGQVGVGTHPNQVQIIPKGMSVTKMYELIGNKNPQYVQNKEGKWIVDFVYRDHRGQFWLVQADAGTGVIFAVRNVTI